VYNDRVFFSSMEIKLKEKSLRNFYVSSLLCTHILRNGKILSVQNLTSVPSSLDYLLQKIVSRMCSCVYRHKNKLLRSSVWTVWVGILTSNPFYFVVWL